MNTHNLSRKQHGFTLVELMIALVLGLLVIMAASAIFLSNRQVFSTTTALNRIQENARAAFEIMARDIREAGGDPCGRTEYVEMLPDAQRGAWFDTWKEGVLGQAGADANSPDSITLFSATDSEVRVTGGGDPSANLTISMNASDAGIAAGDILVVCNAEVAAVFRASPNTSGNQIGHNSGSSNKIKPFQRTQAEVDDPNKNDNSKGYCFTATEADGTFHGQCLQVTGDPLPPPAVIVRPTAVEWTVAPNANGGSSLYRTVRNINTNAVISTAEVAAGVVNMKLMYKLTGANGLVDANGVANWAAVEAVQVVYTLNPEAGTLQGRDLEGTDAGERLSRTVSSVIAIRNREGLL